VTVEDGRGMEGYFAFLRERYRILLRRRAGEPAPWTQDPVLQSWRFCNVRREDDRVTEWFRDNIRDPLKEHSSVLFATAAFRWFNTIGTGEAIRPWLLGPWNRKEVQRVLKERLDAGETLFTGAFMVNSAPGIPKYIDVLDNLDWMRLHGPGPLTRGESKKQLMGELLRVPRLGNFAAYQIVVDLQYTYLLRDAPDLQTFTVAGPGCAKGISLMAYDQPSGFYSYGSVGDQEKMLRVMRDCRDASLDPKLWPSEWPPFVLSDIENGFCEYAKWRTGHEGQRLKRKFTPQA